GSPPDARATETARARGITLEGAARQVTRSDFEDCDMLVARDRDNLADLRAMAPPGTEHKVRLLLDGRDVPDPYYGGPGGFEEVLDLVQDGCERLLDDLAARRAGADRVVAPHRRRRHQRRVGGRAGVRRAAVRQD